MKKENLHKKALLIFLLLALLILMITFCGCSSKQKDQIVDKNESENLIVEEKTVFADIKQNDQYCSKFDFKYDSMKIIKRMTEEEQRTDNVWVDFICHNADFEYTVECVVNYVLYNDGWHFEEYNIVNSNYTALSKPTKQNIINDFSYLELETVEELENWEQGEDGSNKISDPNLCSFVGYAKNKVSEFFTWDITHYINYTFTPEEGWTGRGIYEESNENWNWDAFLGKWSYLEDTVYDDYVIEINHINSNNVSYVFENYIYDSKSEVSEKMNRVTGEANKPKNIPVYLAWVREYPGSIGSAAYFTPYGIYETVYQREGESEPYFGGKYQNMT